MKAIEFKYQNVIIAKDQKEYMPLPALKLDDDMGNVISCWKMSFKDRIKVLFTGIIWLNLCSFNKPLTPSYMSPNRKELFSVSDDNKRLTDKIYNKIKKS